MSPASKTLRYLLRYGLARPSLLLQRSSRLLSAAAQDKVWTGSTPDLPSTFDPQKAWNWQILVSSRTSPGAMIRRMKYFSQGRQNGKQPLDPEEKLAMLNFFKGTLSYALQGGYKPDNESMIDAIQTYINLDGPLDAIKMWLDLPDTDTYSPQVLQKLKRAKAVLGQMSKDAKRQYSFSQSLHTTYQHLIGSQGWTLDKVVLFMQLYNIIGTPARTLWIYRRFRMHGNVPVDLDFYTAAIRAYSALDWIQSAKRAFLRIRIAGQIPDEDCHIAMIEAYLQVGQFKDAWSHYETMNRSEVVLGDNFYEHLILNFNQVQQPKAVVKVFKDMTSAGYKPSLKTLRIVTNIMGKKVEVASSLETDMSVLSASDLLSLVVRQYSMHGQIHEAFAMVDQATDLNIAAIDSNVSYELIAGLCRSGNVLAAESMLREMKSRGIPMHELAYRAIAKCYIGLRDGYIKITELINYIESDGRKLSRRLVNMLIQNHVKFRRNQQAFETYNALRSSIEGVDESTYRILFGTFLSFNRSTQYKSEDTSSPDILTIQLTTELVYDTAIVQKSSAITPRKLFSKMHKDLKGFVSMARLIEAPVKVFFSVHDYPALLALLIYAQGRSIQIPELAILSGISQSLKTGGATKHRRRLNFILRELSKESDAAKPVTLIKMVAGLLPHGDKEVISQAARDMQLDLATDMEWIWSRDSSSHDVDSI